MIKYLIPGALIKIEATYEKDGFKQPWELFPVLKYNITTNETGKLKWFSKGTIGIILKVFDQIPMKTEKHKLYYCCLVMIGPSYYIVENVFIKPFKIS